MVECLAQNFRGARFLGRDFFAQRAQQEALQQCYRNSFNPRTCRIVGCRNTFGF